MFKLSCVALYHYRKNELREIRRMRKGEAKEANNLATKILQQMEQLDRKQENEKSVSACRDGLNNILNYIPALTRYWSGWNLHDNSFSLGLHNTLLYILSFRNFFVDMSGPSLPNSRQLSTQNCRQNNVQMSAQERWQPHSFYIFSLPIVR